MASGAETNQVRNQEQHSGRHFQSDQPSAASDHPQSGGNNHPSSAMNYPPYQGPPPQGYAGYGYNPYPATAYHQDPAVAYYGTTQQQYSNDGGNACFRCMCLIILPSLMITIIASIIFFFVAKPDHTTFKVDNFSVSNFNINPANKVVTGSWDAKVAVNNGRARLRIDKMESNLYQKDTWLAAGSQFGSTLTSGYWDDWGWSDTISMIEYKFDLRNATAPAEEMQNEIKQSGGVTFNLRLSLNYAERSAGFWWHVKNGVMNITCKDLKIGLAVGTNTGALTGGKKDCDVSS